MLSKLDIPQTACNAVKRAKRVKADSERARETQKELGEAVQKGKEAKNLS